MPLTWTRVSENRPVRTATSQVAEPCTTSTAYPPPASATSALIGGGYAVQVVHGSATWLVAVRTGLFSDTLVQVSGTGLAVGQNVEVPSS